MIGDRWGVSPAESLLRYPCDDFGPAPAARLWRGVHVRAATTAVWPWVAQLRRAGRRHHPAAAQSAHAVAPRCRPGAVGRDLIMARRELLNFKQLAERRPA
jgi:hypothetical protein